MKTAPRILILAAALTLTGAALAGCTVRVTDTRPSTSAGDSSASSPSAADEETVESDAPQADDSASPNAESDDLMARMQRSRFTDRISQHVVCVDGQYTVGENAKAAVVEVTGDCREVTILADATVVLLPALDELKVQGSAAFVIVESAREITIDEEVSASTIGWEKGTPIVKDAGSFNTTTPIR